MFDGLITLAKLVESQTRIPQRIAFAPAVANLANNGQLLFIELASAAGFAQLTTDEADFLRCQIGISKRGRGGRRFLPYVFTEQGVAMLSSVLNSDRAVLVNIEIMRAFVKLRQMLASNVELSRRLDELESKYDRQFRVVFDAIRQLMATPARKRKEIGFRSRAVKK